MSNWLCQSGWLLSSKAVVRAEMPPPRIAILRTGGVVDETLEVGEDRGTNDFQVNATAMCRYDPKSLSLPPRIREGQQKLFTVGCVYERVPKMEGLQVVATSAQRFGQAVAPTRLVSRCA